MISLKEVDNIIQEQLKETLPKDANFMRIRELRRNIYRSHRNSTTCKECQQFYNSSSKYIQTIHHSIKHPGKTRKELDKYSYSMADHLRKEHKFYPPTYFTYKRLFWGMTLGLLAGLPLDYILSDKINFTFSISLAILGTAIGQIIGYKKDKEVAKNKKTM